MASQFFHQLSQLLGSASNGEDVSSQFAALLSVDLAKTPQIGVIQGELDGVTDEQLTQLVESKRLLEDWSSLDLLITSYLKLCRDIDPLSILSSHDLLLTYLNNLSIALMNNVYGNHLTLLAHDTISYTIPLIKRVDLSLNELNGKKFKRLLFVSSILSKLFNHLRSLKTRCLKSQLILFIVNHLNKIYFIIDSPLLCANIFANMNLLDHKFSHYPREQQLEYRYILGRYYLIKTQLTKAFIHLNWAFTHTSNTSGTKLLKVLRYLIPVALLIGKLPNKHVIEQHQELNIYYKPLIIHMINGNLSGFQQHLYQNQEYYQKKKLLITLSQRSRIVILRNLFYNIYRFNGMDNRLYYNHLQLGLIKSINNQGFGTQFLYQTITEIDPSFVENVCVSLIDNDLARGNIISRNQLMILSKQNAFPNVFDVYINKFGTIGQEKWMSL